MNPSKILKRSKEPKDLSKDEESQPSDSIEQIRNKGQSCEVVPFDVYHEGIKRLKENSTNMQGLLMKKIEK